MNNARKQYVVRMFPKYLQAVCNYTKQQKYTNHAKSAHELFYYPV